jgi:hypothetical protein
LTADQLKKKEPHYPLKVVFCHDCTTVQLDYTVPKEEMFSEYLYVSGTTQTLTAHFRTSTDRLVSRLELRQGDLVIDIGSNDGTWINCYKSYKIRAIGVEPAKNIADMANSRGLETINKFFNVEIAREICSEYGRPKLVTAAGVFFHLEELHSATQGVAHLLGNDGVFCVQAIYLGQIVDNNEFDNIYHEHLTYWTLKSIKKLFDYYDLEVFYSDVLPIHGGSLELFVGKKGAHVIDASVERMGNIEVRKGYDRIETYRAFADRVWETRDQLLGILQDYKKSGKTVFSFGAPAKGATLLNSFKISTDLVPFAVERNPLKIGKYIPGVRIPIIDEASASIPDGYLILPWNFLDEFLIKKREYILSGGFFIVPVPKPAVIDRLNYGKH